jgi:hypothetical protein
MQSIEPMPTIHGPDTAAGPTVGPPTNEDEMIIEYIRYRLEQSQAKDFMGAYETALLSLKDSPHCFGYELAQCTEARRR